MNERTIITRNKALKEEYDQLERETKAKLEAILKKVVAPCSHCPYDGVYRCEACTENFYEGFKVKDYPGPRHQFD